MDDIKNFWADLKWCRERLHAMTIDHALRGLQIADQPERVAQLEGFIAGFLIQNKACVHKRGLRIQRHIMKAFRKTWPDVQSAWAEAPAVWMVAAFETCIKHVEKGIELPRATQIPDEDTEDAEDCDDCRELYEDDLEDAARSNSNTLSGWGNDMKDETAELATAAQPDQDTNEWGQTTQGDWDHDGLHLEGHYRPISQDSLSFHFASRQETRYTDSQGERLGAWGGGWNMATSGVVPRTPAMAGGWGGEQPRTGGNGWANESNYWKDPRDQPIDIEAIRAIRDGEKRHGDTVGPSDCFRVPHDAHQYIRDVSPPPRKGALSEHVPNTDPFGSKEPKDRPKKRASQPSPLPRPRDPELVQKRTQLHWGNHSHSNDSNENQVADTHSNGAAQDRPGASQGALWESAPTVDNTTWAQPWRNVGDCGW